MLSRYKKWLLLNLARILQKWVDRIMGNLEIEMINPQEESLQWPEMDIVRPEQSLTEKQSGANRQVMHHERDASVLRPESALVSASVNQSHAVNAETADIIIDNHDEATADKSVIKRTIDDESPALLQQYFASFARGVDTGTKSFDIANKTGVPINRLTSCAQAATNNNDQKKGDDATKSTGMSMPDLSTESFITPGRLDRVDRHDNMFEAVSSGHTTIQEVQHGNMGSVYRGNKFPVADLENAWAYDKNISRYTDPGEYVAASPRDISNNVADLRGHQQDYAAAENANMPAVASSRNAEYWPGLPGNQSISVTTAQQTETRTQSGLPWPDLPEDDVSQDTLARLMFTRHQKIIKHLYELDREQKGQLWNE